MQSNVQASNNISTNKRGSNINKNPIGIYETTLMQSNVQASNNISANNRGSNINKNPIGIYETTLMQSNVEGFDKNKHTSKISTEPKPSEYNIMNNKTTMGNYTTSSFPMQSKAGKPLVKTAYPENPFQNK